MSQSKSIVIVCETKYEYEALVSAISNQTKKIKETKTYDKEESHFELDAVGLVVAKIRADNPVVFSLHLTKLIDECKPFVAGLVESCSGSFLGTTCIGYESIDQSQRKVLSQREAMGLGLILHKLTQTHPGYYLCPDPLARKYEVNPTHMAKFHYTSIIENLKDEVAKVTFYSYTTKREDCDAELDKLSGGISSQLFNRSRKCSLVLDTLSSTFFLTLEMYGVKAMPVIATVTHIGETAFGYNEDEFLPVVGEKLTTGNIEQYHPFAAKRSAETMMKFLMQFIETIKE